jgi:cytochrome c biogenesis protein CcmG/thiol:disulfide interchange protein DsbE
MASRGQWIIVGVIVAVLGGTLVAGMSLSEDIKPVRPGSEAPNLKMLNLGTDDSVELADYFGDVVLLNIWATWCAPCEQEMPAIQRLHEQYGPKGVKVVAVSVDASDSKEVLEWVAKRNLTFDVLHDRSGQIERLYQTTGWPESFVIDQEGVIVKHEIGPREWDQPPHTAIFNRLLGIEETDPLEVSQEADRNDEGS